MEILGQIPSNLQSDTAARADASSNNRLAAGSVASLAAGVDRNPAHTAANLDTTAARGSELAVDDADEAAGASQCGGGGSCPATSLIMDLVSSLVMTNKQ